MWLMWWCARSSVSTPRWTRCNSLDPMWCWTIWWRYAGVGACGDLLRVRKVHFRVRVCLPVSGGASGRNLITDIYSVLFFSLVLPSRHSQSADQIRSRWSQGLTRADYPLTNVFICTSSSAISRAFRKLSRHVVSCSCPSITFTAVKESFEWYRSSSNGCRNC